MREVTSHTWSVLDQAHHALRSVVSGVAAQDWNLPSPCEQWTLTQVLQHAAGDQRGFASAITGEDGPTDNPFAPSGTFDGDPAMIADAAMEAASAAWARFDDETAIAPSPIPPGSMTVLLGVGACALDAAVHAWDIAVGSGKPSPLTVHLAQALMPIATSIVEPLRAYGVYAPALAPEPGDDEVGALLRYLGRRPDWTPAPISTDIPPASA
jgi:uncharacterized protein (TIGR03086 family)